MKTAAWHMTLSYLIVALPVVLSGMENMAYEREKLPDLSLSNHEIVSLVNRLRQEDINKIDDERLILDYQGHTKSTDIKCHAERRLFKRVDPEAFEKDTYRTLVALSNNYEPELSIPEQYDDTKSQAIKNFTKAVFSTKVWQILHGFLREKGFSYAKNIQRFRAFVRRIWFKEYSRKFDIINSSGFEHVFLGEYNENIASGMHSWLRFYSLEQDESQNFKYCGYTSKRLNIMASVQFNWQNHIKPASAIIFGSSPEFELALYTLCFLARNSDICRFELDEYPFNIKSYSKIENGKILVGAIHLHAE